MSGSQRIVFNSSLPRSGSTLLQNILAQNPRFYTSPTSGAFELLNRSRELAGDLPEYKAQDGELMTTAFQGFCRGALEGHYRAITDRPVCVDKSRGWFYLYDWIKTFYPDPKIIVCVRDLRAILSSMEKIYRKNRHRRDPEDNQATLNMVTVQRRVVHWLNRPPVGNTVTRLIDAMEMGNHRHFHFVRFEDLTTKPQETLNALYRYLNEEPFVHRFDQVEQTTLEDDRFFPIYGAHQIRNEVAPIPPDYHEVLGKELSQIVKRDNALFYRTFYPDR